MNNVLWLLLLGNVLEYKVNYTSTYSTRFLTF